MTTFGRFGPEFVKFINLSSKAITSQGKPASGLSFSQLSYSLIDQVLVSTQRGNAEVLLEGLQYALQGRSCATTIPDFPIPSEIVHGTDCFPEEQ